MDINNSNRPTDLQISELPADNDDPIKSCINSLIHAMKADYGHLFQAQFKNGDEVTVYKSRLYQKLQGGDFIKADMVNGYEKFVDLGGKYPPTIPEFMSGVVAVARIRRRNAEEDIKIKRIEALGPQPKKIRSKPPIELLREALKNHTECGPEEHKVRMARLILAHDIELAKVGFKPTNFQNHKCHVGYCTNPGTVSHSVTGSEQWFCRKHFNNS